MSKTNSSKTTRAWSTYWAGAQNAEAYASGGVSHPMVTTFWDTTLSEFLAVHSNARILDIATGSGAIIERLSEQPDVCLNNVTCVDIAEAAIHSVGSRFPDVVGVVADARSIPLQSGQYDLVTSQFGIEYAGLVALDEVIRLLAPGGSLIMLMHVRPGVIFTECATALDAVERARKSDFVPLALQLFEAGFAAVRGADRAAYDQAAVKLNPAIQELESVLSEYGKHVAGDTIVKLYSDVQKIHSRMQHYEPADVFGWLRSMDKELAEYEERMASMCEAAIDDSGFGDIGENLRAQAFNIVTGEPLFSADNELPFAWILRANRSG